MRLFLTILLVLGLLTSTCLAAEEGNTPTKKVLFHHNIQHGPKGPLYELARDPKTQIAIKEFVDTQIKKANIIIDPTITYKQYSDYESILMKKKVKFSVYAAMCDWAQKAGADLIFWLDVHESGGYAGMTPSSSTRTYYNRKTGTTTTVETTTYDGSYVDLGTSTSFTIYDTKTKTVLHNIYVNVRQNRDFTFNDLVSSLKVISNTIDNPVIKSSKIYGFVNGELSETNENNISYQGLPTGAQ